MAKNVSFKTVIEEILNDKAVKAKGKVAGISQLLLDHQVTTQQLMEIAEASNDTNRATIVESLEAATKIKADILDEKGFVFAIENLTHDAPRVKWESAKVIANTAHLFPKLLKKAVANLLTNTEHPGSVVRWSAAGALTKILQCKTAINKDLLPAIEAIEKREEDNAIKKIYQKELKKALK